MARITYGSGTIAEVKYLYCVKGLSPFAISKLPGMPTSTTVSAWASQFDDNGKNWEYYRKENIELNYRQLIPQNINRKILEKINSLLEKSPAGFSSKDADALAKLSVSMQRIVDRDYQITMMYQVMTEFSAFLQDNYPDILKYPELVSAIRAYTSEKEIKFNAGKLSGNIY